MAREIERKFLVVGTDWQEGATSRPYRQGYLSLDEQRTVRVRTAGEHAYLTVKGPSKGITRPEFEYEIPLQDAAEMLDALCHKPLVEKTRYTVRYHGLDWEVDVFDGANKGLVVAEVELPDQDTPVVLPPWIGDEVTGDPRYLNANLVKRPFSTWAESERPDTR